MKIFRDKSGKEITEAEHPLEDTPRVDEVYDSAEEAAEAEMPEDEYEEEAGPSNNTRFWPPSREQVLTWVAFGGVILLGAVLRFWGLGDKPLHHDESMHAYFSWQLMLQMQRWASCFDPAAGCYRYDPVLHGPFQFHAIAFTYRISQMLGVYDNGVNNFTARIPAATLGTVIVGLPYFLRDRLGAVGAWLACLLLAVSPSMVYFSRFAREDIYMACFTLLLVVAVARYLRSCKMLWLVIAAAAFALSYATKEATFLTVAVFGSFFGALLVWELGGRWSIRSSISEEIPFSRWLPRTGAAVALLVYFLVLGIVAKWFFGLLKNLSIYITDPKNTATADTFVLALKENTVRLVPWLGILLCVFVLVIVLREMFGVEPTSERHGLARRIDPEKQPLLDTLVTMPWVHWVLALLCGWVIFLILFTVLFTNISGGIGDGVWQGVYYWLQQQQVARGGQPWYYYLLLIPLYEQIGLVFGLVGIVRCLLLPTRFRLFLVYWFVGNLFIYSWAAEKMPWLMIHLTMPMLLLAAIGLEPAVRTLLTVIRERLLRPAAAAGMANGEESDTPASVPHAKVGGLATGSAIFGVLMAVLLLLPTLQNMYQVTYVHAADAPHEMMIYVQTTTDANIVMAKIDQLDRQYYGGKHQMPVGLMDNATWPFAWYLRDYSRVCFKFPDGCPSYAKTIPVILGAGEELPTVQQSYGASYKYHQYHMRTQWDQGYMMPPCVPSSTNACTDPQPYVGVGPLLWLSYGDDPPQGATFNFAMAAKNVWQWWWERKAIGRTDGTYDMGLLIRNDLGVDP